MSRLTIYNATTGQAGASYSAAQDIARELAQVDVKFERWEASRVLPATASNEDIIEAYRDSVDRLMQAYGFQSVDVVALHPDHPDREALRAKFLDEHTHSDFEVRFFVDGRGLFYIHHADKVYAMLCECGDLISVPANTTHWFDMGPRPSFKALRLFTTPEGWVANFTGSDIARRLPDFDQFVAQYA